MRLVWLGLSLALCLVACQLEGNEPDEPDESDIGETSQPALIPGWDKVLVGNPPVNRTWEWAGSSATLPADGDQIQREAAAAAITVDRGRGPGDDRGVA
jgi:hypothetical protein